MIKLYVDKANGKNIIELEDDLYSNEELVEELTYALDIIISDCTVKSKTDQIKKYQFNLLEEILHKENIVLYFEDENGR